MSNDEIPSTRPTSVRVVTILVMLEALAVLSYAVNYALNITGDGVINMGGRVFMLVLCLLLAVWQGFVGLSFFQGKAFTRAPIVLWQLFQLILSVSFLQAEPAWIMYAALLAIVIAGTTIVMLFAPQTTAYLGDRPTR